MAGGLLNLSRDLENEMLKCYITGGTVTASHQQWWNYITGSPNRVFRARLATACTPGSMTYTELALSGYASQTFAFEYTPGLTTQLRNAAAVVFGPAGATWSAITHVILTCDNAGSDPPAFYCWLALSPSITVPSGQTLTFPIGNLRFDLS